MTGQPIRYEPGQLARLLGLPEPTAEQAEVIAAPLEPLAVIAGAGSGKSETMAARLVWLVANGMVRPERVLGLTFTRKAAAELGSGCAPGSRACAGWAWTSRAAIRLAHQAARGRAALTALRCPAVSGRAAWAACCGRFVCRRGRWTRWRWTRWRRARGPRTSQVTC